MVLQTRIFFLVNHFSPTWKKLDLWYKTTFFSGQPLFSNQISRTRFLEPDFSNHISKNCKNRGGRIKGWVHCKKKYSTAFESSIEKNIIGTGSGQLYWSSSSSKLIKIAHLTYPRIQRRRREYFLGKPNGQSTLEIWVLFQQSWKNTISVRDITVAHRTFCMNKCLTSIIKFDFR